MNYPSNPLKNKLVLSFTLGLALLPCISFAYNNPSGSTISGGVITSDTIINNAGTITTNSPPAADPYVAIDSFGSGVVVTNSGTLIGYTHGFRNNDGVVSSLINSGLIRSLSDTAIGNSNWIVGSFGTLTNTASGQIIGSGIGVWNNSPMNSLLNNGLIQGTNNTGIMMWVSSITNVFNNSGAIITGLNGININGGGLSNNLNINSILNRGSIFGTFGDAIIISSVGIIQTLTNSGIISSTGGYGVNNGGVIGTLNNSQNDFTFRGTLPTNYNIIVRSPSNYGQLAATSPSGATVFGIYGGGVDGVAASSFTKGTYRSVLTGITSTNLSGATSGNYGGLTWTLRNSSGTIWDLVVTASTTDTQQSLVNTASALQGTFTLQNSVMVNGFTYDCPVFDKHGICVSAGGRNTTVQAQGINNTSGLLIASYRLNKNNSRIGAWVDQNLSVSGPGTVQLGNSTPMIGLFGVWSQRPDGVGAEVKVSAAYGQKDTTITRQVVGTSDPGSGSSQLISQGAQVVAKYGFAVMPDVVVSPYAGLRYTQNNMGGYTEATTNAVTAPLTYSALNTNATTALAGAEARYRGIPKTTLFASAGVETDTNTSNGSYSATGITGLTPVNFNPNPVTTRPTATVGGYYDILKNQRIGITGIYRQEPFQAMSTTTVLATYTIGL